MSFEDFEAMDGEVLKVIDLTTSKSEQIFPPLQYDVVAVDLYQEEEPDAKRLKTDIPQRSKEDAILEFLYEDKSNRLETILQSAGVTEEQYVQFPMDECFINPERSSDDITEPSKCIYM
jgi:hypothetical protein